MKLWNRQVLHEMGPHLPLLFIFNRKVWRTFASSFSVSALPPSASTCLTRHIGSCMPFTHICSLERIDIAHSPPPPPPASSSDCSSSDNLCLTLIMYHFTAVSRGRWVSGVRSLPTSLCLSFILAHSPRRRRHMHQTQRRTDFDGNVISNFCPRANSEYSNDPFSVD